jgi:Na+(H+)/acetate symporter ActP
MEKYLAERGVTLIPASSKEVWAVPTSDLARYQLPPVNVRGYSLLYTYSLIIALVCGTAGLPHILVRFYTNPDGVAAKRTTMWVMILIGIFYVFPPVFGVLGRNLMPELYTGLSGIKGHVAQREVRRARLDPEWGDVCGCFRRVHEHLQRIAREHDRRAGA